MDAEARDAEILARLLARYSVSAVARDLGCNRSTVRAVRDRPEVQVQLAEARAAREAAHAAALDDARRILREGAPAAALAIVDATQHPDPHVRVRAARELLDRVGIPRVEEVQTRNLDAPDLAKLTDEELATWERLSAKVAR
jgi:transposase-like protein